MHIQDLTTSVKNNFRRLVPVKVIQSQLHKQIFKQFAEKVGLVYFGYVDQRNDEHALVRGLTVSTKHRDNHYCIGTFDGYDVTIVERSDTIHYPGKPSKPHNWIIMTFDLHHQVDLPHIFLGLHTHNETFYAHLFTKFAHLSPIQLSSPQGYSASFARRYTMFTKPEQSLSAERLFNQSVTNHIADTFGTITVEISENCLYLYAENQRPTPALLNKLLSRGIWLANSLDQPLTDTSQ